MPSGLFESLWGDSAATKDSVVFRADRGFREGFNQFTADTFEEAEGLRNGYFDSNPEALDNHDSNQMVQVALVVLGVRVLQCRCHGEWVNTFSSDMVDPPIIEALDGTRSVVTVQHNKGTSADVRVVNQDGLIVYPLIRELNTSIVQIESNIPLTGILYIS